MLLGSAPTAAAANFSDGCTAINSPETKSTCSIGFLGGLDPDNPSDNGQASMETAIANFIAVGNRHNISLLLPLPCINEEAALADAGADLVLSLIHI